MAPEQLAGKPATVQSDIYALGLVLYEVFTGKRAFAAATIAGLRQQQESGEAAALSSATGTIDPAIEAVVQPLPGRNPGARPASAISVAARLPGGDPLAAALAAGETPSPAMVAAAGESGGLGPRVATACLAGFFVFLAAVVALVGQYGFTRLVPLEYPPDVLANKAQEMLGRFGYGTKPLDVAHGMYWNKEYIDEVARTDKGPDRWAPVQDGREAANRVLVSCEPSPPDRARVLRDRPGQRPRRHRRPVGRRSRPAEGVAEFERAASPFRSGAAAGRAAVDGVGPAS